MRRPRSRLHLAYGEWPLADRLLWELAFDGDDPFTEAAGARLAKATQHTYLFGWRRFLGFLAIQEPAALGVAPSERLTMERVRSFVAHLAETNIPISVATQVDALYHAARVMMPECDWTWLKIVKARLYRAAPAHAHKGAVITSLELLDLGEQLMEESQPAPGNPISPANAVRYRDGFMVALLAFIPLRRKNLAELELDRHLVREGNRWSVIIPAVEAKTGTPVEFPIPELLDPYLTVYLDIVRPRLLRRSTSAFWVSGRGGALTYSTIGLVFERLSRTHFGRLISPHDARDAAATTWALAAPDQIGIARDLLAHTDLRTTTKHYNRARGIEASRRYGQLIAGLRRKQNRDGR